MDGFFQSFNKMNINLNESDEYKDLRKIVQNGFGINRDKIFNTEEPYKLIDKEQKNKGLKIDEHIDNSKNAPEWFNKISNEYILLDMFGYQEDNVNTKKGRKETFRNTTEDAFHASFASTCNFYVLNDNKSYKKTKKIFEKLSIKTIVLKPAEFVDYYNNYLDIKELTSNIPLVLEIIKKFKFHESEENFGKLRTYITPYYLFDIFTKVVIIIDKDQSKPFILLSHDNYENQITYVIEIIKLVDDLNQLFGNDVENFGKAELEEFHAEKWKGRKWIQNEITYRLIINDKHIQLYLDY